MRQLQRRVVHTVNHRQNGVDPRRGRLDVEIGPAGGDGSHPVRVDRDGAVTTATFKNPFGKDGLIRAADRLDKGLLTEVTTKSLGSELFRALFGGGPARSILDESRGEGRRRLRFIAGDGEVASIPWELLYDPSREEYVAHSGSISRWIRVSADVSVPPRPTLVEEPLRTLVVLANPTRDELDLDAEAQAIQAAFSRAVKAERVQDVELLPQATLSRVRSALTAAANAGEPFHVVHFAGHTGQDPGKPSPYLRFEADDHDDGKVDPETFANVVAGHDGSDVRLVFLNACGTLQPGESRSGRLFPGFAAELLRRGVPAIVGTQSQVLDSFAVKLASRFYESILDGNRVDEAMSQVRELIHGERAGEFSNIGIPICYLSSGDGRLATGPPTRLARWRENLTPAKIAAMVGFVIFTLVPGAIFYFDRFVPDPPPPIVGDFRVGVAEFDVLDPETELGVTLAGDLSGSLYNRLIEPGVLNCGGTSGEPGTGGRQFGCQGPETAGVIRGEDSASRSESAASYAADVNADLVVYGGVHEANGLLEFTPEIYLSGATLARAEELSGVHVLETRVGPVSSRTQIRDFRGQVEQLALDLGDLVIALSYYSDASYAEALEIVDALIDRDTFGLDESLLHLVEGNLHVNLAAAAEGGEGATSIEAADTSYRAAIAATPGYGRGWLGLGEISYQLGRGQQDCAPGTVDPAHLGRSIERYQQAIESEVTPGPANVELKAEFGVGRTTTCLAQAGIEDSWDKARARFLAVVAAYEMGESGLEEFASESYSLIAHIDVQTAESDEEQEAALEQSIDLNEKAREATRDARRIGVFSYLIADAYRRLGQPEEACDPLAVSVEVGNPAAVANQDMFDCG